MKTNQKLINCLFLSTLLLALLSACGSRTKFVAPEIDPPADLIPGYVPEGFELKSGFKIKTGDFERRAMTNKNDGRVIFDKDLIDPVFILKSPAGNELSGVYYQKKDWLLLITKSHFPAGTLDLWQTTYETSYENHCDCFNIVFDPPIPIRIAEIQEIRTIGETPVAILKGAMGWVTVFVRGDYLIAVESGISLEENLKIVSSLMIK